MRLLKTRTAACKALTVLVPSYAMAYSTEKMVWVIPTLAAASFFAANIEFGPDAGGEKRLEEVHEPSETDLDVADG